MLRAAGLLCLVVPLVAAGCYDSAHPCVKGLEHGGSYRITLGEQLPAVPLHTGSVSCNARAFDSLKTGSALELTLPEGQWGGNQYCEVPLADLTTDLGLMLSPVGNYGGAANGGQPDEDMFVVNELGLSGGCPIRWSLGATSRNGGAAFPAGLPGQDLFVVRSVQWSTMPGCPPLNSDGSFVCFDAWKITFENVTP